MSAEMWAFCGSGTRLHRFGRCQSASASRRAGCCLSAHWGTPGHHWEPEASASPGKIHKVRVWISMQTIKCAIFTQFCWNWGLRGILGVKLQHVSNSCTILFSFFAVFMFWFLLSGVLPLSLFEELLWNTFSSKEPFQIAAIRQFAMLEIKPRTSEVDDDTDPIWEPGSRALYETVKHLMTHKMG